jgi:hypothetical protein
MDSIPLSNSLSAELDGMLEQLDKLARLRRLRNEAREALSPELDAACVDAMLTQETSR